MDQSEREVRTEVLLNQSEDEKKTLKSSLVALQNAYDEKEKVRMAEMIGKQRAEAELVKMKILIDKANNDLVESTNRAKVCMYDVVL